MFKRFLSILLPFLLILLVAACAQRVQSPTPVPSPAPTVLAEAATPTLPSATATDVPTASPSPVPSETPLPTATATASASATPTPLLLLNAEDFGTDRNPLTGEKVADPTVLRRHPVAVKIPNNRTGYVRPQSGLSEADLVFEHITEFGVTRFTAIFYDQLPGDVGPLRSARLIDLELPAMYDAALSFAGASIEVRQQLYSSDFRERLLDEGADAHFRTGADIPFEHTLYARPPLWIEELQERGLNGPPQFGSYMAFGEEAPEGGRPVSRIHLTNSSASTSEWRYDAASNTFLRWMDGDPHLDQNTDEQIAATNVVVVYAPHVLSNICECCSPDYSPEACRAFSMEIQIWGEGRALVLRDGLMYEATWKREERDDMLTFYDAAGNPLPLQIGNTWFQMAPSNADDIVTVES